MPDKFSNDFITALKNHDTKTLLTIPKSDVHNHLGRGCRVERLSELQNQNYWLTKIKSADWAAAKYLAELVETKQFHTLCGSTSKVFLLIENQDLISFCTFAEKDDIPDTDLTPWIGFVYTFPQFRGKRRIGILIEHICSLAKNEGHKNIYISTDQQGLYENFGFSYDRTLKDRNGEDSLVYKHSLEQKR